MCYINSQKAKIKELMERYGRNTNIIETWERIIEERKFGNEKLTAYTSEVDYIPAFIAPMCSVITDKKEIQLMQWGLIPSMTKNITEHDKYIKGNWFRNAKSEEIFHTWTYKYLISRNRCIFPSTGYYEYHHNMDRTTTLYYIYLKDEPVFSMAGIWDIWQNPETKNQVCSFSIMTTAANKLTSEIHNGGRFPNRMPLILNREDEEKWVDPKLDAKEIASLLKVYDDSNMDAYPVNKNFNKQDKSQLKLDF